MPQKPAVTTKNKTATFVMTQKAPKKNSVLFESKDQGALLQACYVMRDGAKEHFGINDLDAVKELTVTMAVS